MKSANFVVLFESSNLVGNLVTALRYNRRQMRAFLRADDDFILRYGAIPIIALEQGVNANAYLPFSEVLDWNKALVITTTQGLRVRFQICFTQTPPNHDMNVCRL